MSEVFDWYCLSFITEFPTQNHCSTCAHYRARFEMLIAKLIGTHKEAAWKL